MTNKRLKKPWPTLLPRRRTTGIYILLYALLTLVTTVEVSSLISVQFWVGYAVWAFTGFCLFPFRIAIPNRRKAIGPFVRKYTLITFMFVVYLAYSVTGRDHSPLLFLAGSFPGLFLGVTVNLSVITFPFQKVALCQTCRAERAIVQNHADWYCTTCGALVRTAANAESELGPRTVVRDRKVPKGVHARKIAKDNGDGGDCGDGTGAKE